MSLPFQFAAFPAGNFPAADLDSNWNFVAALCNIFCTATGTGNAIVLTPAATSPAVTAYQAGMTFTFVATANSVGGAITLRVGSLAIGTVFDTLGVALVGGEIVSGTYYEVVYDAVLAGFRLYTLAGFPTTIPGNHTALGSWTWNETTGTAISVTQTNSSSTYPFGFNVLQTVSGAYAPSANYTPNLFAITANTPALGAAFFAVALQGNAVLNGGTGNLTAVHAFAALNATSSNAAGQYVGMSGVAQANVTDGGGLGTEQGSFFGAASVAIAAITGATHLLELCGMEADVAAVAGTSVKFKLGFNAVCGLFLDTVNGSTVDGAFVVGASTGGALWKDAFLISNMNAAFPMNSGATIMRSDTAGTVARGIDFNNLTFTTSAFNCGSDNFLVDTAGNMRCLLIGIGGGASVTTWANIAAATTARSQIRLATGGPPTSPVDGDIWFETNVNTGLKIRINGVTKTVTVA